MIDYAKLYSDLKFKCNIKGVVIIDNPDMDTEENELLVLEEEINNALQYAYNRVKGADSSYTFTNFESDFNWHTTIVNMAFTSIQKGTAVGVLSSTGSGITETYESGGRYLLSDIRLFVPRAGV